MKSEKLKLQITSDIKKEGREAPPISLPEIIHSENRHPEHDKNHAGNPIESLSRGLVRKHGGNLRVVRVREVSAVPHIPRGDVADDFGSDNGVLPEQREDTAVDGKVECKRVRRPVRLQFRELLHEGIQKNIRKMPVGRNE